MTSIEHEMQIERQKYLTKLLDRILTKKETM